MIAISWVKSRTVKPLVSIVANLCYWIRHFSEWKLARRRMEALAINTASLDAAKNYMAKFRWQPDGIDWTPWTITAVHRYMTGDFDDCDGAAVLWRYLFKCCGMDADIWHLRGESGHAVAITEDGRYMGSNHHFHEFAAPDNWKDELLNRCFNGRYDYCYK